MIKSVENKVSFTSVKFDIGPTAKERKFINLAISQLQEPIDSLGKLGIDFDVVRSYNHDSKPTENIRLYLHHTPNYPVIDSLQLSSKPNEPMSVRSVKDAYLFLIKGISKAIAFLPEHLERAKKYAGIEKA